MSVGQRKLMNGTNSLKLSCHLPSSCFQLLRNADPGVCFMCLCLLHVWKQDVGNRQRGTEKATQSGRRHPDEIQTTHTLTQAGSNTHSHAKTNRHSSPSRRWHVNTEKGTHTVTAQTKTHTFTDLSPPGKVNATRTSLTIGLQFP